MKYFFFFYSFYRKLLSISRPFKFKLLNDVDKWSNVFFSSFLFFWYVYNAWFGICASFLSAGPYSRSCFNAEVISILGNSRFCFTGENIFWYRVNYYLDVSSSAASLGMAKTELCICESMCGLDLWIDFLVTDIYRITTTSIKSELIIPFGDCYSLFDILAKRLKSCFIFFGVR